MFSFAHLLIGLSMAGLGVVGVKWTYPIMNATGRQFWLEKYTGSGSTYGVYKIGSVLLIMFGILVATGFGDAVMNFLLSPLYHIFAPLSGLK